MGTKCYLRLYFRCLTYKDYDELCLKEVWGQDVQYQEWKMQEYISKNEKCNQRT